MAVLVTGGKGFIGARVVRKLVERGHDVVCLEPKATLGRLGDLGDRVRVVEGDIVNYDDIADTVAHHGVDRIAHMVFFSAEERGVAGRPERGDELYRQQMVMNTGTFHLFEVARLAGIRDVVFPSSVQYHGHDEPWQDTLPVNEDSPARPTTTYGIGKHLCEKLAAEYNRLHGMNIVTVRVPGAYGPGVWQGARGVNLIGTSAAIGEPVHFPYRDTQHVVLAHVDDIAEIMVRALLAPRLPRNTYHVGGHYVSYAELAKLGRELLGGIDASFDASAPEVCAYPIDSSSVSADLGITHRSLQEGYGELIRATRADAQRREERAVAKEIGA